MKNKNKCLIALSIVLGLTLSSCFTSKKMLANANGPYYKYTFAIREATTHKRTVVFDNDSLYLHFDPEYNRVNFTITNKLKKPIEIVWDKSALEVHNQQSKIIHTGISIAKRGLPQVPTRVDAGKSQNDFLLPINYLKKEAGSWTIQSFYPAQDDYLSTQNDWIMRLIGNDLFSIRLALRIDGNLRSYWFHFYPIEIQRGASSFMPQY